MAKVQSGLITLTSTWQQVPIPLFFLGFQADNRADRAFSVRVNGGAEQILRALDIFYLSSETDEEPFRNTIIELKGSPGDVVQYEIKLFDYQE